MTWVTLRANAVGRRWRRPALHQALARFAALPGTVAGSAGSMGELHGRTAASAAGRKAVLLSVPVVELEQQFTEHDGGQHGDDNEKIASHRRHATGAKCRWQGKRQQERRRNIR